MKQYRITLSAILLVFACLSGAANPKAETEGIRRYPNELPGFKFYETSKWKSLTPLIVTMADVRRVLGEPKKASDVSQFLKPYPGDAAAKSPVFHYDMDDDWEMLIYFVKYSDCKCPKLKKPYGDRLYSVELVPNKPIPFDGVVFPPAFKKKEVWGCDAAWDEYADGSGLSYEIYITKEPYGNKQPGDLNRIVYAPSAEEIAKLEGE